MQRLRALSAADNRQAASPQRSFGRDDSEEDRPRGQHRDVLETARPSRRADRWSGRREGPLDGQRSRPRPHLHQHHRRRADERGRYRLPWSVHR